MINYSTRAGKQPSKSGKDVISRPGSDVRSGSVTSSEIVSKKKKDRIKSVSRHIAMVDGKLVVIEGKSLSI